MKVTFYFPPNGEQQVHDIPNVDPDDEKFFVDNGIKISMENLCGAHIVYADLGIETEDGDPIELIEIASGRTCVDTLSGLRSQCEKELNEMAKRKTEQRL